MSYLQSPIFKPIFKLFFKLIFNPTFNQQAKNFNFEIPYIWLLLTLLRNCGGYGSDLTVIG